MPVREKNNARTVFSLRMFLPRDGCRHPVILHRFRFRVNASYTCGACVDTLMIGMVGNSETLLFLVFTQKYGCVRM